METDFGDLFAYHGFNNITIRNAVRIIKIIKINTAKRGVNYLNPNELEILVDNSNIIHLLVDKKILKLDNGNYSLDEEGINRLIEKTMGEEPAYFIEGF